MRTVFKAINIEITPSLEKYIEMKLVAPTERLIAHLDPEGASELDIEVARTTKHHHKGMVYAVQAHLKIPKKIFRLKEAGPDVRMAIDEIKRTLHTAIQKHKDLQITKGRRA